MKAKKLPKVWIAVNERGTLLSFGISKSFLTGLFELREGESIHQYAPVQKPRRCAWTERGELWDNCEGVWHGEEPYKFCPLCGGKVKR